jgi:hypothetical protein
MATCIFGIPQKVLNPYITFSFNPIRLNNEFFENMIDFNDCIFNNKRKNQLTHRKQLITNQILHPWAILYQKMCKLLTFQL